MDLEQYASMTARVRIGCVDGGLCLRGTAALAVHVTNPLQSFMIASVSSIKLSDLLLAFLPAVNLTAARPFVEGIDLIGETKLAQSSSRMSILGEYSLIPGLSFLSSATVLDSATATMRGHIAPMSSNSSATSIEIALNKPFLLGGWMKFGCARAICGADPEPGPLIKFTPVDSGPNENMDLHMEVLGHLHVLGISSDTSLMLTEQGHRISASVRGPLFGGLFNASVRIESPAGELHTALPFDYKAELDSESLSQMNVHLLTLFQERVSTTIEKNVVLYQSLADAAETQGIRVLASSGEAIIDQDVEVEIPEQAELVAEYRKALSRFEESMKATRGIDLLGTALGQNSSDPVIEWCGASIEGRVAAAVNRTSVVDFNLIFLGHSLSFRSELNLQQIEDGASLLFEPLWDEVNVLFQTVPTIGNATIGNATCTPAVVGLHTDLLNGTNSTSISSSPILAAATTSFEFEIPDVQLVANEVGPLGSVQF
jgi:hypothetical protein